MRFTEFVLVQLVHIIVGANPGGAVFRVPPHQGIPMQEQQTPDDEPIFKFRGRFKVQVSVIAFRSHTPLPLILVLFHLTTVLSNVLHLVFRGGPFGGWLGGRIGRMTELPRQ